MIGLQRIQHDIQRARELLDLCGLFRRQLVQVLVHRLSGIDLVGHAVQPRRHARGKREHVPHGIVLALVKHLGLVTKI